MSQQEGRLTENNKNRTSVRGHLEHGHLDKIPSSNRSSNASKDPESVQSRKLSDTWLYSGPDNHGNGEVELDDGPGATLRDLDININ